MGGVDGYGFNFLDGDLALVGAGECDGRFHVYVTLMLRLCYG